MTKMATTSFARIHCQVGDNSDDASDICLAMRGDWEADPAANDLEIL